MNRVWDVLADWFGDGWSLVWFDDVWVCIFMVVSRMGGVVSLLVGGCVTGVRGVL